MSSFFPINGKVLRRRWPYIHQLLIREDVSALAEQAQLVEGQQATIAIDGIQLTSRHDRVGEARKMASNIPADVDTIVLYGMGLGDLPRHLLRQRNKLKRLVIYPMNLQLLYLIIHLTDQSDWMADPRVELRLPNPDGERVFAINASFVAELELADVRSHKLRDRVLINNVHGRNNEEFDRDWLAHRLQNSRDILKLDRDVSELFSIFMGREFYVLATGPTLSQNLDKLKFIRGESTRAFFIAVDTALKPLLDNGIYPDLVVTLDPGITTEMLEIDRIKDIPLVYIPYNQASILSQWRGPRYCAYHDLPLMERTNQDIPHTFLYAGGSVIHPAVDLAVRMGASQVTLFGADFAFPGERTHTGWEDGVLGTHLIRAKRTVPDGHGNQVKTMLNFCMYLNAMEYLIEMYPHVKFMNASRDGARIQGTEYHPEFVQC